MVSISWNVLFLLLLLVVLWAALLLRKYRNKESMPFLRSINQWFPRSHNAIMRPEDLIWTGKFRANWLNIKNEYVKYCEKHKPTPYRKIDSFGVSFCDMTDKWHVIYLKAFCKETKWAEYFPVTMDLIRSVPTCTLAFFSVLKGNANLLPHRGLYGGVHRYHLALIVPKNGQCALYIDGKVIEWQEGQDLLFDDMYEHSAVNRSTEDRVVLFMDIKREFNSFIYDKLNDWILSRISTNDSLKHFVKDINNQ